MQPRWKSFQYSSTYAESSQFSGGVFRLGSSPQKTVSRSQLPLLLTKVNLEELIKLTTVHYDFKIDKTIQEWFSADGKELRGSISTGSKRGDCIVQVVRHSNREVVGQRFYNGQKESEVPTVKELLEQTKIKHQKVSLDALHLKPNTLKLIDESKGKYLIGLKGNQKKLLKKMRRSLWDLPELHDKSTYEKGHGRYEQRNYTCYNISSVAIDQRWEKVNFQTLIQVHRKRKVLKTNKQTEKVAYYISNIVTKNIEIAKELFDAVRNHWQIEVNNNIRDCILKEDKLCSSNSFATKTIACCRTLTVRLLDAMKVKNRAAQLDLFADKFHCCLDELRAIKFL